MLMLDQTTPYYYFLSNDSTSNKRKFSAGINEWAESISKPTVTSKFLKSSKSTLSHGSSMLPPLTHASSRSSTNSVLTKSIMISQAVPAAPVKVEVDNDSVLIISSGISDKDETMGLE
jgi:hypothetical protein